MLRILALLFLSSFLTLNNWALSVRQSVPLTYSLENGWNLVSVYPTNGSTAGDILAPLMKEHSCAFSYRTTWQHFCSGAGVPATTGSTALDTISYGQGFFLQSSGGQIAVTASIASSATLELTTGWNLVSMGFSGTLSGATHLPSAFGTVVGYGSAPGQGSLTYQARVLWPALSAHKKISTTLDEVDFTKAYFVYLKSPQSIAQILPDSLKSQMDLTAPSVNTVFPSANATDISTATSISIAFSESLDPQSVTSQSVQLLLGQNPVSVMLSYQATDQKIVILPNSPLTYSSTYTVVVSGVTDLKGNPLNQAFAASFATTQAPPAPFVSQISPLHQSNNQEPSSVVQISMSEAIDASTVTTANVRLLQNGSSVSVQLAVSGSQITMIPSSLLAHSTVYTVEVSSLRSLAHQIPMTSSFSSVFSIRSPIPFSVQATSPASNATQVTTSSAITVDFTTAVLASSVTSQTVMIQVGGQAIGATLNLPQNTRIQISPVSPLPYSTAVAIVLNGVQSWEGIALSPVHSFSFQTEQAPVISTATVFSSSLCDTASLAGEPVVTSFPVITQTTAGLKQFSITFPRYAGAASYGFSAHVYPPGSQSFFTFTNQNKITGAIAGTAVWSYDAGVDGWSSFNNAFSSSLVDTGYRWEITPHAYNTSGTILVSGAMVSITVGSATPPKAPSWVWGSAGNSQAALEWCPVGGASHYKVEMGSQPWVASSTQTVTQTSAQFSSLANDQLRYFWVRSSSDGANFGDPSQVAGILPAASVASDLTLESVSLNQGSEKQLWPLTNDSIPVIEGRTGVLRLGVGVSGNTNQLKNTLSVTLSYPDTGDVVFRQEMVSRTYTSAETSAGNQANILIPGSYLKSGVRLQVQVDALNEVTETQESNNSWPTSTGISLTLTQASKMIVRLVPLAVNSVVMPQDVAYVTELKTILESMFPMNVVSVGWHPMNFANQTIQVGSGSEFDQWDTALDNFSNAANAERGAQEKSVVYYGVFRPEATDFGTAGLSGLAYNNDVGFQNVLMAGIGLGYGLKEFAETAAHEIGHNFGRSHVGHSTANEGALCSTPGNTDVQYPHANGLIGATGYSHGTRKLLDPTYYWDIMSYCNRVWISDYNYKALHDFWSTLIATHPPAQARPRLSVNQVAPLEGHFITVKRSQNLQWNLASVIPVRDYPQVAKPGSVTLQAEMEDGSIQIVPVSLIGYDHGPGLNAVAFVSGENPPVSLTLRDESDQVLYSLQPSHVNLSVGQVNLNLEIVRTDDGYQIPANHTGKRFVRKHLEDGSYRLLLQDNDGDSAGISGVSGEKVDVILGSGLGVRKFTLILP